MLVLDELAIDLGRLAPARFLALSRMMNFGCVDTDVAHLLDTVREPYVDRVAVDDADDRTFERRRLGARNASDPGEKNDERKEPGAARQCAHSATLSPRSPWCQHLDTMPKKQASFAVGPRPTRPGGAPPRATRSAP